MIHNAIVPGRPYLFRAMPGLVVILMVSGCLDPTASMGWDLRDALDVAVEVAGSGYAPVSAVGVEIRDAAAVRAWTEERAESGDVEFWEALTEGEEAAFRDGLARGWWIVLVKEGQSPVELIVSSKGVSRHDLGGGSVWGGSACPISDVVVGPDVLGNASSLLPRAQVISYLVTNDCGESGSLIWVQTSGVYPDYEEGTILVEGRTGRTYAPPVAPPQGGNVSGQFIGMVEPGTLHFNQSAWEPDIMNVRVEVESSTPIKGNVSLLSPGGEVLQASFLELDGLFHHEFEAQAARGHWKVEATMEVATAWSLHASWCAYDHRQEPSCAS